MRVLFIPLQSVLHVSLDIYHLSSDELQSCTDCIKNTWDFLLLEKRHKFDVALLINRAEMFCNHIQMTTIHIWWGFDRAICVHKIIHQCSRN
jgi:hypothetical protein